MCFVARMREQRDSENPVHSLVREREMQPFYFVSTPFSLRRFFLQRTLPLVLAAFVSMGGCAAAGLMSHQPSEGAPGIDAFRKGEVRLQCGSACAGKYGANSQKLRYLYSRESWMALALSVMDIGAEHEEAYFYLGRAAEGLGDFDTALTYYRLSLATNVKCGSGVWAACDGLTLPKETEARLAILTARRAQSKVRSPAPLTVAHPLTVGETSRQSPQAARGTGSGTHVKLSKSAGVYEVPVVLNGVLKINMILDSGASELSITPDVLVTLVRTRTVSQRDFLGTARYQMASGAIEKRERIRLKSVRIGDKVVHGVLCSVSSSLEGTMLLGQSLLERLGKYTIDYSTGTLVLY